MGALQSGDVYYKRLKVLTRSVGSLINGAYSLNGQLALSESVYNFNASVGGKIDTEDPNILKVLGFSIEFPQTNLVSRRQLAYTCLKTSKQARENPIARNLATFLTTSSSISDPLEMTVTPVYQRDGSYLIPSSAVIEGLRDTAAKKRRFIKTVIQTTD
jgi:hypothetical protein